MSCDFYVYFNRHLHGSQPAQQTLCLVWAWWAGEVWHSTQIYFSHSLAMSDVRESYSRLNPSPNQILGTLTESDADKMRSRQNETQPSRAPKGLRFGWLVDQYTAYTAVANPQKISTLEQQEACATFCQRCFATFWNCVSFWQSI